MASWFVWSICLVIRKTPSPSGATVVNSSSSASDSAARQHALQCTWHHCRRSLSPWPQQFASLLQGLVGFEPCKLLLYCFVHLFIPPPGLRFPLVVLGHVGETADFGDSIQQRVLQLLKFHLYIFYAIAVWIKYHIISCRHDIPLKAHTQNSVWHSIEPHSHVAKCNLCPKHWQIGPKVIFRS